MKKTDCTVYILHASMLFWTLKKMLITEIERRSQSIPFVWSNFSVPIINCINAYWIKCFNDCLVLKNALYIFRGAIRTFALVFISKMHVFLVCVWRSSWWVSSGPRRSVCTGGIATCRRHRAPIDSPSSRPGFCGGRARVKSTHSQHSSTSPAGEMSLLHRAPITCFVHLPISSPSGPPALSLALLLPNHCTICCYCKYLNRLVFIWSTSGMSSIVSRILIMRMVGYTF